jgi:hypothetical protein
MLLGATLSIFSTCHGIEGGSRAERLILEHRIASLKAHIAQAEAGQLVSDQRLLVAVHERVLREVLAAQLPLDETIAERFRIHLTSAQVSCDDGLALLRFEGQAGAPPVAGALAVITVYAVVDVVDVDANSGVLRCRFTPLAFEAQRIEALGAGSLTADWLSELSHLRLDAFSRLSRSFALPVRLEQRIAIPGLGREQVLSFSSGAIGLDMSVAAVWAHDQRLWIALATRATDWQPDAAPTSAARAGGGGPR